MIQGKQKLQNKYRPGSGKIYKCKEKIKNIGKAMFIEQKQ